MLSTIRSRFVFARFQIAAFVALPAAFLLASAPQSHAAPVEAKVQTIIGSGTTTIVSLQPNPDGTLAIQAVEAGTLTHFGKFTGAFSYVATYVPTGIQLVGSGTLTNEKGDTLVAAAYISEIGSTYPFRVLGVLQVIAGTGAYTGAKGAIVVTGSDTTSLTDNLDLAGEITVVK